MIDDVKKFAVQKIHMCDGKYKDLHVYPEEHMVFDGDVECTGTVHVEGILEVTGSIIFKG